METVREFRNRLQHADDGIQQCVREGREDAVDDYFLKVRSDRVSLGDLSLPYAVLARAIEALHDTTRDVVAAEPGAATVPPDATPRMP